MPKPASQTRADIDLAKRASKMAAREVTPGQIHRWRKAGLLPMRRDGHLGRAWIYEYPEGSAEFAAAISRELPRYGRLESAAKGAFARKTSPAEKSVLVRLLFDPMKEALSSVEDPHREAARLARRATRRASRSELVSDTKRLIGGSTARLSGLLGGGFAYALAGDVRGLGTALEALELPPEMVEELDAPGFEVGLRQMDEVLANTQRIVDEATLDDFNRARDEALEVYEAMADVEGVLAQLLGIEPVQERDEIDAMELVIVFLVLRSRSGDEAVEGFLDSMRHPETLIGLIVDSLRQWADESPEAATKLAPLARSMVEGALSKSSVATT